MKIAMYQMSNAGSIEDNVTKTMAAIKESEAER